MIMRFPFRMVALAAALATTSLAQAAGSAPMRFKNATDRPVYVRCDDGGRGAHKDAIMADGGQGTLVEPGCTVRIPDTNDGDIPSFRVFNKDGHEICSQRYGLLTPIFGAKWEVKYDGKSIGSDD